MLQWPTLLTLAMFPVLVWRYSRLAIQEEHEVAGRFGEAWHAYAACTPRCLPRLRVSGQDGTQPQAETAPTSTASFRL